MKNLGGAAGTCCWRGAFNGLHYERRDGEGEEIDGDVPAADRQPICPLICSRPSSAFLRSIRTEPGEGYLRNIARFAIIIIDPWAKMSSCICRFTRRYREDTRRSMNSARVGELARIFSILIAATHIALCVFD